MFASSINPRGCRAGKVHFLNFFVLTCSIRFVSIIIMNPKACLSIVFLAVAVLSAGATPVFFDDFNSYGDGNLVGQGSWLQTGSVATSPIQVNSGVVSLGTSGQDVYAMFSSPVNNVAGTSIYVGASINVSGAQSTGDYFLHVVRTPGTTSTFYDKVYAKATTGGYLLGLQDLTGTVTYGTTVLGLGTSYRIVLSEDFVAGDMNDTFALYVDPTDLSVAVNNTPYLTATWSSVSSEAPSFDAVNLRQGTSTSAPTLTLDNLAVGQQFSEVAPVPEPSTVALFGAGGVALRMLRHRTRTDIVLG
jgi:hypothetical protein